MKKINILVISIMLLFACLSYSHAFSYSFYGEAGGGTGSALMNINISGNTLTATLDNTSPVTYFDSASNSIETNNPCITGFGFNLTNNSLANLLSWTLEAEVFNSAAKIVIGSSTESNSEFWDLTLDQDLTTNQPKDSWDGLNFNFLPHVENGHDGALYNPALKSLLGEGGNNTHNYFTTALLTMNYSVAPVLGPDVVVRMTRVGKDGSLKLNGTPDNPEVPEPGTMFLLGSLATGLFGFAGLRKKFKK